MFFKLFLDFKLDIVGMKLTYPIEPKRAAS